LFAKQPSVRMAVEVLLVGDVQRIRPDVLGCKVTGNPRVMRGETLPGLALLRPSCEAAVAEPLRTWVNERLGTVSGSPTSSRGPKGRSTISLKRLMQGCTRRKRPERPRVGWRADRAGFWRAAANGRGLEPDDWKPMPSVGPGVREIRVRDASGAFRTIYLATHPEAVYVLQSFRKTSQKTAHRDIALARRRLNGLPRKAPHG